MEKRTQTLSQSFAKIDARLSHRIPPTLVVVQPSERKGCSFDTGHGFSRVSLVHAIQVKQYRALLEGRGEERKREKKKETYHRVAIIARSSRPTYFCPVFTERFVERRGRGRGEESLSADEPRATPPPLHSPFESKVFPFPWKSSTSFSLFPPEIGVPWHRRERILIFASN